MHGGGKYPRTQCIQYFYIDFVTTGRRASAKRSGNTIQPCELVKTYLQNLTDS